MRNYEGCQIPCLQQIAEGRAYIDPLPINNFLKRTLAKPWNYQVKNFLRHYWLPLRGWISGIKKMDKSTAGIVINSSPSKIMPGDWVRVKSREEIETTLNSLKELKGCAFLDDMWQYCDRTHQVLQRMERFLDERDYKGKKCSGLLLLKDVLCTGTPIFGRCDRCCHYFWREEWLEKIEQPVAGKKDV
jgi:hypothetical protein